MNGVLNESTETVHKRETGRPDLHTACGVTYNVSPDQLRPVAVELADAEYTVDKCGRCFDEGGGY